MRFDNYLYEDDSLDEIVFTIKDECEPFLRASRGWPLYRGYQKAITTIEYLVPKIDRQPKDMHLYHHQLFDTAEFVKHYSNKDLSKAISSGHEIMFKCHGYYLLNPSWLAGIGLSKKRTYNDFFGVK